MRYENAAEGYANLWRSMRVRPDKRGVAETIARRLIANRKRYDRVAKRVGCPWWFVAIVHNLESGANFTRHLHNGDPLTARTTHVPAGRPEEGSPPFTWEESAADALANVQGLDSVTDWTIPRALYEFERYNGFGYVGKVNSPYVWSFSDLYDKGKYVADGRYDPEAVSRQCGAAVVLEAILRLTGEVTMTQLQTKLKPYEAIMPNVFGALVGPLAGVAIKAFAEVFGVDRDPKLIESHVDNENLETLKEKLPAVEELFKSIVPVADPLPAAEETEPSSPIDALFGDRLKGWKTVIGIVVGFGIQIVDILAPGTLSPIVLQVISLLAGAFGLTGLAAKIDRIKR